MKTKDFELIQKSCKKLLTQGDLHVIIYKLSTTRGPQSESEGLKRLYKVGISLKNKPEKIK